MSRGGRFAGPGRRSPRGPGAGLLAALLMTVFALAGCGLTGGAPRTAAAHVSASNAPGTTVYRVTDRRPAPALTANTLDGRPLALRDLTGSGVVVINVWASWCTSCRAESAALAAVAQEMHGRPVQFLGIDEEDSVAAAHTFLAGSGATYPQISDPDGEVLHALSLLPQSGIPSTLLLDPRGRMAARVIGPVTEDDLRSLIGSLQEVS